MHEFSIAKSVIDSVIQEAELRKAHAVLKVELEIGTVSGIVTDALKTAIEALVIDSVLEKTEFVFKSKEGIGRCRQCNKEFPIHEVFDLCPFCGSANQVILQGKELNLLSIDLELP
jgi:hydrogenase nickel incorporation protein HypA/HybF